ncbi:hypothetical protein PV783_00520 [Chitinophaga sp. CC14]|uniref:hypothetical protein n=1 Tax=Chitinophaga sp. CC14 TaxID=3029199 RepID=UPI003B79C083
MNKTLKQVLLLILIPVVCTALLFAIEPQATMEHLGIFKYLIGGYIIMGLILLFTGDRQLGKSLLIAGGVLIIGTIASFIVALISYTGIA